MLAQGQANLDLLLPDGGHGRKQQAREGKRPMVKGPPHRFRIHPKSNFDKSPATGANKTNKAKTAKKVHHSSPVGGSRQSAIRNRTTAATNWAKFDYSRSLFRVKCTVVNRIVKSTHKKTTIHTLFRSNQLLFNSLRPIVAVAYATT